MCLACEQDAIWLAYLESQGLLKPDDPAAVETLFAGFPVRPLPVQSAAASTTPSGTTPAAAQNPFLCDDPKAG
jgi:hypothetical protein